MTFSTIAPGQGTPHNATNAPHFAQGEALGDPQQAPALAPPQASAFPGGAPSVDLGGQPPQDLFAALAAAQGGPAGAPGQAPTPSPTDFLGASAAGPGMAGPAPGGPQDPANQGLNTLA